LSVYLDASVVVAMFTTDPHSDRAKRLPAGELLIVSDLTAAEFASALAIHRRNGRATDTQVRAAYAQFDSWCALSPQRVEVVPADLRVAEAWIRRLQHPLRAPDATHLAIARRLNASLATFDEPLGRAAADFGIGRAPL
jgi:uncharacterized protein